MSKDNIVDSEIQLIKNDEFYVLYEMLMESLKTEDVKEGLSKSLLILRTFLNSGNIALYRKNENGFYVFKMADSPLPEESKMINSLVNKTKEIIETKEVFDLELGLSKELNNELLLHIGSDTDSEEWILAISNIDGPHELNTNFLDRIRETMEIILKREIIYEKTIKAITTDVLTGLDNRNSYERRLKELNEADNTLVLGIFDLFRLKYINDTYTHTKGDVYIKEAAKILDKYWPKQTVHLNDDGSESFITTGHCIFRVGGDEFVLLTNVENIMLTQIKADLAKEEAGMIKLGIDEEVPLALNYGLALHSPKETMKDTFTRADKIMQEDKRQFYKKYNLDRRK